MINDEFYISVPDVYREAEINWNIKPRAIQFWTTKKLLPPIYKEGRRGYYLRSNIFKHLRIIHILYSPPFLFTISQIKRVLDILKNVKGEFYRPGYGMRDAISRCDYYLLSFLVYKNKIELRRDVSDRNEKYIAHLNEIRECLLNPDANKISMLIKKEIR